MHNISRFLGSVIDLCRGLHLAPLVEACRELATSSDLHQLWDLASGLPWLHLLAAVIVLFEAVHSLLESPAKELAHQPAAAFGLARVAARKAPSRRRALARRRRTTKRLRIRRGQSCKD